MFSLLYGLFHYLFAKPHYYVPILGIDGVGKTTLLERIKAKVTGKERHLRSKIVPTVGLNLGNVEIEGIRVTFWDLGGEESLRPIWNNYYKEANGLIYVIDAADGKRLDNARNVFCIFDKLPILIVANKCDVQGAMSVEEVKKAFALDEWLPHHKFLRIQAVSATSGEGVRELLEWLIRLLREAAIAKAKDQENDLLNNNNTRA
jgi:ADP-ribosylation factor related protein 1